MTSIHRHSGISMTEYGLIIALAVILVVVGLSLLGGNLDDLFRGTSGSLDQTTQAAIDAGSQGLSGQRRFPFEDFSDIPVERSQVANIQGYQPICLGDGLCVRLPVVSGGAVSTTGGNGGQLTREFAKVLQDIADQLAADPDADQELALMVRQLANKGHEMADYQRNQMATRVTRSSSSLTREMVERTRQQATTTLKTLQVTMQPEFKNLLGKVNQHLATKPDSLPPAAAELIRSESNQIIAIVDSYGLDVNNHVGMTSQPSSGGSRASAQVPDHMTTVRYEANAMLTEQSANTICNKGAYGLGCTRHTRNP